MVVLRVSLSGFGYLCLPEIRNLVFPRWEPVAMPKVAVNEDGDLYFGEDDVRFAWQLLDVFTKPQASLMEFRTHACLQSRILPLDTRHTVASLRRCQIVRHVITALDIG